MSLIHLHLKRKFNDEKIALYEAISPGFNDERKLEVLGLLRISKDKKNYTFLPSETAMNSKMFPPELYSLSEEKRDEKMKKEYSDYGWEPWAATIDYWAKKFILKNEYPEKHPK